MNLVYRGRKGSPPTETSGPEPRDRGGARPLPSAPRRPRGRPPRGPPGGPGRGRRGAGGRPRWGTGPESDGVRRPEPGQGRGVLRSRAPPHALAAPAAPRSVHAGARLRIRARSRMGRAVGGRWAGGREGGAPVPPQPLPPRRPQTFTKRHVRPHQSPLIIVGWAAGGGRGSRACRPAGPLGTGSAEGAGARARRLRAEGGSEA